MSLAGLRSRSTPPKGGSTHGRGATEHLDRTTRGPVYARSTGDQAESLNGLRVRGALPWPHPNDPDAFIAALSADTFDVGPGGIEGTPLFQSHEETGSTEQLAAATAPQPLRCGAPYDARVHQPSRARPCATQHEPQRKTRYANCRVMFLASVLGAFETTTKDEPR